MSRPVLGLRSPLVLCCVRDYLAGKRHELNGVAQLDLECAAGFVKSAAASPRGPAVRAVDMT